MQRFEKQRLGQDRAQPRRTIRRRFAASAAGLGLLLAACGGSSVPNDPAAQAANEAASANIDALAQSDNALDIEVLNVADGSVSTLRQSVTGDRPVLVWFYAPH